MHMVMAINVGRSSLEQLHKFLNLSPHFALNENLGLLPNVFPFRSFAFDPFNQFIKSFLPHEESLLPNQATQGAFPILWLGERLELGEVEMQANAERGIGAEMMQVSGYVGSIDNGTETREFAPLNQLENASVPFLAVPKIISIDNKVKPMIGMSFYNLGVFVSLREWLQARNHADININVNLSLIVINKIMKKKKAEGTVKLYRLPGAPIAGSNEIRLKQIYDSAYNSREKSPTKNSLQKNPLNTRYQLPLTDRKADNNNNKNNRYQSYLQNQVISQARPNRRYQKAHQGTQERSSVAEIEPPSKKRQVGQSVDMFKIRKSRHNSSRKVSTHHLAKNLISPLERQSETSQPKTEDGKFEEAKKYYKLGKFEQALPLLEECLSEHPTNCDYLYYTAIISLNQKNYQMGLDLLVKIIKSEPKYKASLYIFAAISAKNLQQYQVGLDFCHKGLQLYPANRDLILYSAKLHEAKGDNQAAHNCYELILKTDKANVEILIKNAEILQKMGAFTNCMSNLSNALYADVTGHYKADILSRKVQINLEQAHLNIKEAKRDLHKLTSHEEKSSRVFYFKGMILLSEGFRKEAILSFEQSIKEASEKEYMARSLVEITKGKIEDRDFYSAYYHIGRSQYLDIQNEQIEIYRLFTEGVVYLMKRKITEGDSNFEKLVNKYPEVCPYLHKIFYLYRAFAKFCLSSFEQSIQDYEKAHSYQPLDVYARFNKLLAEGIVRVLKKEYENAIEFFDQAETIISYTKLNKIEPYLYRSASHVEKAKDLLLTDNKEMEELKSLEEIFTALKELDHAYDINDGNSNLLYYRSLIYLHLGKYQQALQDIIKAISKSEENVAKYFFFRALAHSSLGNKKQALNDFNICNNLDEKFTLVYLERAKINFSNENVTKGLEDLIKLKNHKPQEDIKFHEACLNYVYGHYVMANACCDEIQDEEQARAIKILIKMKLGRVKDARKLVRSKADSMILKIIQGNTDGEEESATSLEFFTLYHYQHYLGVREFMRGNFERAIDMFVMATKERALFDLEQGISNNSINQNEEDEEEEVDVEDSEKDTIHKINFNIFVCYLMIGEWKKAYEVFVRDIIGAKQSLLKNEYMATFSHLLFQSMKPPKVEVDKEIYELNLYESKLNRVLNQVVIELPNIILKTRLCLLGMNNTKLEKAYKTKVNPDFILTYMKMNEVENRPEPPWVKREDSGLIFTDEVQNINVEFQTTENDEEEEEEEDGDEDEEEEYEDESAEVEESGDGRVSVNKFKQQMKLDDSIERKLQKIMERRKKQSSSNKL